MIITNNSPTAGSIAWQDVVIKHKNITYNITNGNSAMKYIWWDFTTPAVLQESNTQPVLEDNDAILFINDGGTHYIVWSNLVHGAAVKDATLWIKGQFVFTIPGELSVGENATLELFASADLTITEVFASVKEAPTDADLIIDVNKNDVTIFTDQDNRPTIADGDTSGTSGEPDVTTLEDGDKLTISIDQIGSSDPGEDLTVCVKFTQVFTY